MLALLSGVTVVGGLALGVPAVLLGLRGRQLARERGGSASEAVAGAVLGVLGLLIAGGVYLWVRDELAEYSGCRKESLSIAQDQACEDALRRSLIGD